MATKTVRVTPTNLFVLQKVFADSDEIGDRVHAVDYPHLKRCLAAGLLQAVPESRTLRLTASGRHAIGRA